MDRLLVSLTTALGTNVFYVLCSLRSMCMCVYIYMYVFFLVTRSNVCTKKQIVVRPFMHLTCLLPSLSTFPLIQVC